MELSRRRLLNSTGLGLAGSWTLADSGRNALEPASLRREEDLYLRMVKASDAGIPNYLARQEQRQGHPWQGAWVDDFGIHVPGGTAGFIRTLIAVYSAPESSWYHRKDLIPRIEQAARYLLAAQHEDGTIDLYTTNFHSTPDTAFVVEPIYTAVALLRQQAGPEMNSVTALLDRFLAGAARALRQGGVHTPNHRWVVCAALAMIHRLYPDERLIARIDDWLGEGIDIDADGQYTERSTVIYSPHVDRSFLTMADLLQRPALLEPVRRNLEMTLFYLHADGEVATEGSSRQDQFQRGSLAGYYLPYRHMALRDKNGRFAAAVRLIEEKSDNGLAGFLAHFMNYPELRAALPESAPLPVDFHRHFSHSELVRIRRGPLSATILGKNATFLSFHKGSAALEAMRLASAFFGKGQFVSPTLEVNGDEMMLSQHLEGPYYQPISPTHRRKDGDWSKMDRSLRPRSEVQKLDSLIKIKENAGRLEIEIEIQGCERVPVAIELSFRKGGKLSGVIPVKGIADAFLLQKGMGRYQAAGQTIDFGEGQADHHWTQIRGASPKPEGLCVYLTGFTPFQKRLTVS